MDQKKSKEVTKDFNPREYQIELFERALKNNTIIFLPTGSGKTFIAVMLIKHKSYETNLPYSEGGKRTFFLVDTVALVAQQAQSIRQQTPLSVGEYSGDRGVDFWDLKKWQDELENHQVLVMTAAIFYNMILHGYITFSRVNVLVFDECHHAVNNHPMKQIMKQFEGVEEKDRPRILGLTATLLNSNVRKIPSTEQTIHNLEVTFHAKIARAENEEMIQKFATSPEEKIVVYDPPDEDECYNVVKSTIEKDLLPILREIVIHDNNPKPSKQPPNAELLNLKNDNINEIINILKEIILIALELGGYATRYALLSRIVYFERQRISSNDPVLIKLLGQIIIILHLIRKKLDLIMSSGPGKMIKFATPKLRQLIALLNNFEKDNVALVFVERRTTAKVLCYIFDDIASSGLAEFENIKPDFMVGYNSNCHHLTREYMFERKKNNKTLKKFNSGETNVLFASDVIEEGVDIKNCNFVIKFDEPKNVKAYIQSKGRARHQESKYVVLTKNGSTYDTSLKQFKEAENFLKEQLCYGRDVLRTGGSEREAEELLYSKEIEPFYANGDTGAKVTIDSSISLLNRYCSALPSDKFTKLTVFYWKRVEEIDGKKKVIGFLQLPVNSPLKEIIEGPPCNNLLTAKGAVALKACEILYKIGELNSNLLPAGNSVENTNDNIMFPLWERNDDSKEFKPGTKKCRRIYDKHFPNWICESVPKEGQPVYLHALKVKPNFAKPEKDRLLGFYNLLQSEKNFSVLTTKKWPKLCNFPLFLNVGEVEVVILQNARKVELNKEQIKEIFDFHCLLFTEASILKKEFLVKIAESKENSYYVVPTILGDKNIQIDWDTIRTHKTIPPVKPIPINSRESIVVSKEKYLNKIVIPWYRIKGYDLKYVVTKVCEEETPMSPFPSEQYDSYSDYFSKRYNQSIFNQNQKLIEVRAISGKLNFLLPRGKYRFGKKRRRDDEDFEETLVPELCTLLDFPAVYMLKVTLLPSILHRVTLLLNAEELRQKIAAEAKLGIIKLPKGVYWKPLVVDGTALTSDENTNVRSTIEVSNMLKDKMVEIQPRDDCGWDNKEEPVDLERNLRNLDLLSIIHYEKFAKKEFNEVQNEANVIYPPNICAPEIPILHAMKIGNGPQLGEILKAIVGSSANDIMNYERLETLGDSFLKYLVSLILFVHFKDKDEGKLSYIKGKIIGNKNLFYCGKNINLGEILKAYDFVPDDWDVPGFNVLETLKALIKSTNISPSMLYQISLSPHEKESGVLEGRTIEKIHEYIIHSGQADENTHSSLGIIGQQSIVDKVIADAVEALIGVYLESCGIEGAFDLCAWLKVIPQQMCDIKKILYSPPPTALISSNGNVNDMLVMPDEIEKILGYKFKDRSYLLQAVTHCSFTHYLTDCYQRLEFLGDAILDFLITSYIYCRCKNITPGELTDLRSALVNNVTFACLTVRYGLHKFMLSKACKLTEIIKRFAEHQEKRNHKIGAEILFLLNEKDCKSAEIVDVPKALGDIFESLAAAVYLDSGKSLDIVWKTFYKLMHNEIEEFIQNIPKNSIRLLYEKFPLPAPSFGDRKLLNDGKGVMISLIVNHNNDGMVFVGVGENGNKAKLAAAKLALRHYHFKDQL